MVYRVNDIEIDKCFKYTKENDFRYFDKQIALVLTKLCFEHNLDKASREPIDVFKYYWRELATMV